MESEKFYKESWISAWILKDPLVSNGKIYKGAMILNQVDPIVDRYPDLKNLFIIIERHGWHGPNEATQADIMLVDDLNAWEFLKKDRPNSILLDIGPPDFVDTEAFRPLRKKPKYDVIQISCWSRRKRIELLIEAASLLPDLSFVHFGHFENNGTHDELMYRNACIELAKEIAPNVHFPYARANSNDELPDLKESVNDWINEASLGVLTTTSEGINRFKMECLSADRPCLVPDDVSGPTRKHINEATGILFSPSPRSLSTAIRKAISKRKSYSPRSYVLANTGQATSMSSLKSALRNLCYRKREAYRFDDIVWDGRNQSLLWGQDALRLIESAHRKYRDVCDQPFPQGA